VALPAFFRRTPLLLSADHATIDIFCLLGQQQQTCSSGFIAVGQTDRRTPCRYKYLPATHTMRAVPMKD